jgi:hypothetical protein
LQDRALGAPERLAAALRARPVATRWVLAGPVALAAAVATMTAMPVWVPPGAAGVDEIVYPMVLVPLLWAVPFFYACLEENLVRGAMVLGGAAVGQGALVALAVV